MLSQCYEERRSLAAERAELSVLQKRALEREKRETQKSLQVRERRRRREGRGKRRGEEERGEKWEGRRGIYLSEKVFTVCRWKPRWRRLFLV